MTQKLGIWQGGCANFLSVLITHEHTDHIQALDVLGCRMGIPVFANGDTAKAIFAILDECPKFKIFSTGEAFEFGDLEVHPFSVQHDAVDPVAFTIQAGGLKLGFCTDLGFVTTLVAEQLRGNYLYVEANHEPSMVHASARPKIYKQRVLSRQGHLSNGECAKLIELVHHSDLKHIHLAHLSSECIPKVIQKLVFGCVGYATNLLLSLAPCACTMVARSKQKICATALPNSQLLNHFRYNSPELALKTITEKLRSLQTQPEVSIAFQDMISKAIIF